MFVLVKMLLVYLWHLMHDGYINLVWFLYFTQCTTIAQSWADIIRKRTRHPEKLCMTLFDVWMSMISPMYMNIVSWWYSMCLGGIWSTAFRFNSFKQCVIYCKQVMFGNATGIAGKLKPTEHKLACYANSSKYMTILSHHFRVNVSH